MWKNSRLFLLSFCVLWNCSLGLKAAEVKRIEEKHLILDGKLDETSWKKIKSPLSSFHIYDKKGETTEDTRVKITHDDKWLYLGVECNNDVSGYDQDSALERDGTVGSGECIEILLSPVRDRSEYYHFFLNCENVKADRKGIVKGAQVLRDTAWNPCWLSGVSKNEKGWTAEIAIPLSLLAKNGKIENVSFNIARTKVIPQFDSHAVRLGEKKTWSSLFPIEGHENKTTSFSELNGLETVKCPGAEKLNWQTEACKLCLDDAAVGNYYVKDGNMFYDVFVKLSYSGESYNWAYVTVMDKTETNHIAEVSEKVCASANRQKTVKLSVPVDRVEERVATVFLKDYFTKGVVDQLTLANLAELTPLKVSLDRNYYTSELNARLACSVSLPPESLKQAQFILKNERGETLFSSENIKQESIYSVPLDKFVLGENALILEFIDKHGKKLFQKPLTLIKRHPKPGYEWKIDLFNRTILNNGEPFFPFGIVLARYSEKRLKVLKNMGCNMFFKWSSRVPDNIFTKADEYGLYVMDSLATYSERKKIPHLTKYLSGDNLRKVDKLYNFFAINGTLNSSPIFKKLKRQQRNEIYEGFYQAGLPSILNGIKNAMNHKSLMGYVTFDEPHFSGLDMFVQGRDLYAKSNALDGYHPTLLNYSSHIPPGSEATDWCDILCTDPYWVPDGSIKGLSSVNRLSNVVYLTNKRAEAAGKVTWTIPLGSLWCAAHKRPISPKEQICQSYLALIHGAKGITYFTLPAYQPIRDAIKTFGKHLRRLSAAVLASPVKNDITYRPIPFKPLQGKFPAVQAAFFQYPDGNAVLLAANATPRQVSVSYSMSCLSRTEQVKRLFAADSFSVINGVFRDSIEPFGVRAYQIKLTTPLVQPVKIAIQSKVNEWFPSLEAKSPTISYHGRIDKKNIYPNPSFENFSMPDWPDYIRLFDKTIVGDHLKLVKNDPYDGKTCIELTNRKDDPSGILVERVGFHTYCAPQHPKPETYTLSVYMKGSKEGLEVYFGSYAWKKWNNGKWEMAWKPVKLTTEWKRYSVTGPVPANLHNYSWVGVQLREFGTVWVDAMQVEKGEQATAFDD